MNTQPIQKAYTRYSNYYDKIFGRVLQPGRKLAAELINQHSPQHAQILEVGVGTGLSLPLYRNDLRVVGIDISSEMLTQAQHRLSQLHLASRVKLIEMDAQMLTFQNNSFDAIAAMYVASVVQDLPLFLDEMTRVCKTGGDIFVVNHFSSQNNFIHSVEKKLAPFHQTLGFQPDFPIDPLLNYAALQLVETHQTNLFGYWKLLHFVKK